MTRKDFLQTAATLSVGATVSAGPVRADAQGAMDAPTWARSLDGEWLLATDPGNRGREEEWSRAPRPEAVPTRVPWIIQDAFPGYHGVAWYWRSFGTPENPHPGGRYLLRFHAVDYMAEVWLNGTLLGRNESPETPFILDATTAVRDGDDNLLAVRVLNPTNEPIDGIVLAQVPHRNKVIPYSAGSSYNHGGIVDSVELLVTPRLRVSDLVVRPDWRTGDLSVEITLANTSEESLDAALEITVAPAASGETATAWNGPVPCAPGETRAEAALFVADHQLWDLNDPYLYRASVRVREPGSASYDERSTRCGFRDFRLEGGCFRLNGRRIYLRCSHTGNHCPVGLQLPPDPDMFRRDLLNVKVMGFNAIRFIAGLATPYQLDLCDEIGLLVYEESYASWCLAESPRMAEHFDRSTAEMIRRDRNHASLVIWGLLNETPDGPLLRHARDTLALVRSLDPTRMVMLNSGRWDVAGEAALAGLQMWRTPAGPDPNVTHNPTDHGLAALGVTWQPGQLAFHPGPNGEYSVVRWTCPRAGDHTVEATFTGIAMAATTDVHVLHNGKSLLDGLISLEGQPNETAFAQPLALAAGDVLDFVLGYGNRSYGGDSTALAVRITDPSGQVHDAAEGFAIDANPSGPWAYGYLTPGTTPDSGSFRAYPIGEVKGGGTEGGVSNPGSQEWEDILDDQHPYQRTPHTAPVIGLLRTVGRVGRPMFISEYGVGSGVDLWRAARHYERLGKTHCEDAVFYRDKLDRFLADYERWHLDECFAGPEEFFAQSVRKMAGQRLLGLNAIRANPSGVGHSLTGTVDQGMSGEGLCTTFRELKPGTTDAVFETLAPLRLCLFAEPWNLYAGSRVRLEAVLANDGALPPGEYPVRFQVVGPDMERVLVRKVMVAIAEEGAFAIPFFDEELQVDGAEGTYRLLATMESGGAPTGGEAVFRVFRRDAMPAVDGPVTLWGEDAELRARLDEWGVPTRPFAERPEGSQAILVGGQPEPGGDAAWSDLARCIETGSFAIFLSPDVFREGDDALARLPLANRGSLQGMRSWLYHKDEWCKRHPILDGLQSGGPMDYDLYRNIISDVAFIGQDPPEQAIAGACDVSLDYASGLMLAAYRVGRGLCLLNTLRVRENLGADPVAERLLRNMLQYASGALG